MFHCLSKHSDNIKFAGQRPQRVVVVVVVVVGGGSEVYMH